MASKHDGDGYLKTSLKKPWIRATSLYHAYFNTFNSSNVGKFFWSWILRACLPGGGGPQVGEVTRLGGVTHLSIQSLILMWSRLHVRWSNPPHVTSPTWGPPPSCKQALKEVYQSSRPRQTVKFVTFTL